ncbi:hypothetical protein HDU76_001769 [Blyttiomyces sp. JEL0837]|nr:hypothetical protein HDU76_001769 [Blyttiomyces sp. JEL0837]
MSTVPISAGNVAAQNRTGPPCHTRVCSCVNRRRAVRPGANLPGSGTLTTYQHSTKRDSELLAAFIRTKPYLPPFSYAAIVLQAEEYARVPSGSLDVRSCVLRLKTLTNRFATKPGKKFHEKRERQGAASSADMSNKTRLMERAIATYKQDTGGHLIDYVKK